MSDIIDMPAPKLAARARLVALKDAETHRKLVNAAAQDQHLVIAPTHVMLRGEEIIGYLSLGALPVVQAWFDSKSGHVLDSLKMIEMGEAIFDSQGVKQFAIGVTEESPFAPHMERLGFTKLGSTVLWHKTL